MSKANGRHVRSLVVRTTIGTVEGFSRDGVTRWRAIPYGEAPRGAHRLRAPRPATAWRGVRHCREFTFCAPQRSLFTITGLGKRQQMSEDCLSLNVVAPNYVTDAPLPVMFFVHGGGYAFGSTATPIYDGANLVRRGCVYVSANYRIGPFGALDFSSLSSAEYPIESNLFIRDLVLALRWVRDNIAAFGGDPDNVTLFGESAGGHAVSALLAVPAAENLFHRAIAQSPPGGMVRSADAAAELAEAFVDELGGSVATGAQTLMNASSVALVDALERVMKRNLHQHPGVFGVGATVDGDILPQDPVEAMASGQAHRIPLIIGHNADEARLFARFMDYLPTTRSMIDGLIVDDVRKEALRKAYPDYPRPAECVRVGGDIVFGSTAWRIAEAHGAHAPTYAYRYDYAPRALAWSGFGATHATELLALFDTYRTRFGSILTAVGDQRSALRVSADIQRRWLEFGTTGAPGEDWPRYDERRRAVRVFDRRPRVEYDPAAERRLLWKDFSLG
jgi:para-nitrobenzyl esterase